MQIGKRISFSWDGVWAEWWLSLMHPQRINAGFLFPFFNFPWFQEWNAVFT